METINQYSHQNPILRGTECLALSGLGTLALTFGFGCRWPLATSVSLAATGALNATVRQTAAYTDPDHQTPSLWEQATVIGSAIGWVGLCSGLAHLQGYNVLTAASVSALVPLLYLDYQAETAHSGPTLTLTEATAQFNDAHYAFIDLVHTFDDGETNASVIQQCQDTCDFKQRIQHMRNVANGLFEPPQDISQHQRATHHFKSARQFLQEGFDRHQDTGCWATPSS